MDETRKVGVQDVLRDGHKGPAVEVPFNPEAEWGLHALELEPGRQGYPVEVLFNGSRFRSGIVPRMSRFFVLVDEKMARRAGAAIGRKVKLTVWAVRAFGTPATETPAAKARPAAAAPAAAIA